MPQIMKGNEVVDAEKEKILAGVEELNEKGITPTLAIMRVGEKPDDIYYESSAVKRLASCGMETTLVTLPAAVSQKEFDRTFDKLNNDPGVDGILLLCPLPKTLSDTHARETIHPDKDVDCMGIVSEAGVYEGYEGVFAPCTPAAAMMMLRHYDIPIEGKEAVIIGRSMVVGKPMAMLLLKANATVTVCHTRTKDLPAVCKRADILIVSAGKPQVVNEAFIKPGVVVIDVGINVDAQGNIVGDVDYEKVEGLCSAITPVPGGVGAVTTLVLAENTLQAARRAAMK